MKKSLNVDIGRSIAEFQAAMKEFELKYKLYRIIIRGKGLEFDSYREFSQDEDATAIDWKASMRANKLLAKKYKEERNLKVIFIIDIGENMVSGSAKKLKCEYALEVIAAFAHLIITSGDKIGYVTFNDEVRDYVRAGGGRRQFNRMVSDLTNPEIYYGASDLNKALDFIINYVINIDSLIIVSDFLGFDGVSAKKLSLIASKTETLALMVKDPIDRTLPDVSGELVIEDEKTGQQLLVNPSVVKNAYEKFSLEQEDFLKKICRQYDIDIIELITDKGFVPHLSEFLKRRTKKINIGKGVR